jgi:Ser/Thr protein kinase RdoA (MazF antagonist)
MRPIGAPFALPRPSRLSGWVAAKARPPRIGGDDARRVLERYGVELIGRPSNLTLTWRNHLVVVRTTGGRKVLKQYRETSNVETIAHEHSIIDHLESRRFPCTRLDHTADGSSIVDLDGRWFASFAFEPGRHLAATYVPPRRRRILTEGVGRTLARLHHELLGFEPKGSHHLARHPDGAGERGLTWHLEALDRLCDEPEAPRADGTERDLQFLREQADRLRVDLVAAGTRVEEAGLPRLVIHGDYGTHNLLFRTDGTAVVHDFELARYDWRLLDLVIASLRLRPELQATFIAGYRTEGAIPDAELALLPWLWRYHLLSGAVRSWQVYGDLGGPARLSTARARLLRAAAGPSEALTRWR